MGCVHDDMELIVSPSSLLRGWYGITFTYGLFLAVLTGFFSYIRKTRCELLVGLLLYKTLMGQKASRSRVPVSMGSTVHLYWVHTSDRIYTCT